MAQNPIEIPLKGYGGTTNGITDPEKREGIVLKNISQGALYIYLPKADKRNGKSIVFCPGGGYAVEALWHEGHDFARWVASEGYTGIVYKYRLPNGHPHLPLADAEEVFEVIRAHATEWSIDPQKVGIAGFSAGGHLASTILTQLSKKNRPNFGILFYPVISASLITHMGSRSNLLGNNPSEELIRQYSNEEQVTSETPPTLLLYSDDDQTVNPRNATLFYEALKGHKIKSALYIYPSGGHGWGFNRSFKYHEWMKTAVLDWLSLM